MATASFKQTHLTVGSAAVAVAWTTTLFGRLLPKLPTHSEAWLTIAEVNRPGFCGGCLV